MPSAPRPYQPEIDRSSHLERHDLSRGLLAALADNVFEHGHLFCISGDTVTDQVICVDQVPMRHKVGRWTDPLLVVGAYTWSRHDLFTKRQGGAGQLTPQNLIYDGHWLALK